MRLDKGAPGQRLAGDAGGKAKVIFDARAGACLAAIRPAVQHQHMQSLGGRVDRRRQAGRAGADDGDVEHLIVLHRVHHADAARQRVDGRIEQHRAVRTNHQDFARRRAVLLDQRRGFDIAARIDHVMRLAVAEQEILQAQDVR